MAQVLVLGANGHLGRAAVQSFADAGWSVSAHLRRAPRGPLPTGVRVVQCDALDVAELARAGRGADVIVNALNPEYTRWATLLPPLTEACIGVAAATGATLMVPGNVYNFGNQLPAVLREDTPFAATHPKAAQRIALEAALATAAQARGVRSIVIRAGDFLGDEGTWIDRAMGKGLAAGKFTQMGPADLPHAWAWLPDLANTFVRVAAQRIRLAPHAVLHFAGHTLTGAQLQQAFETALGRPLQSGQFPWGLLRLATPFSPMLRALFEMRYLWQRPHQLDNGPLQALIGPEPHTPLPQVARGCLTQLQGPAQPGLAMARQATQGAMHTLRTQGQGPASYTGFQGVQWARPSISGTPNPWCLLDLPLYSPWPPA